MGLLLRLVSSPDGSLLGLGEALWFRWVDLMLPDTAAGTAGSGEGASPLRSVV